MCAIIHDIAGALIAFTGFAAKLTLFHKVLLPTIRGLRFPPHIYGPCSKTQLSCSSPLLKLFGFLDKFRLHSPLLRCYYHSKGGDNMQEAIDLAIHVAAPFNGTVSIEKDCISIFSNECLFVEKDRIEEFIGLCRLSTDISMFNGAIYFWFDKQN